MLLVAGLGNPGQDYAGNRHNAGFMAVDAIADRHGFSGWKAKGGAQVAEGRVGTQKIIAIKPQSYMNKSGLPVAEIARFYKIPPEDLFVFYDEIDLAAGKIRVKRGGGHGGHNGIRDIDRHLGTDYWRVRIGVGRPEQVIPGSQIDIRKWVLMDFAAAERDGWLAALLRAMADEAPLLAAHDEGSFMSRVAHLAPAPKPPVPESETGTDMASNAGTSPDGEET
ncbi:MAG: aminoacyl-tRNA hydrolase [Pseudomonadota bacterium]|nr:aminoacyl-tRNA hydrolase [Pseudomonadota bacterium]